MDVNLNNITKMYDKLTYYDQYGGSLVLFIIITIIVIILITYFHAMINIQPIIDDWPNQRCKPTIIPFAGFITHPEGISATDYTSENFAYCTQNILSSITGYAVQPLTSLTNLLQSAADVVKNDIQSIRAMFDKIRSSMQEVSQEIMGRIMNVMISLMQIIISFKDLVSKIQGTMTAGLFTLLGSYYTLQSLMGAIAQFIVKILIALAAMIAAFWVVPFTWGAAISNTVIFIAISIPMAIILSFMVDVLKVNSGLKIPKVKCFDKNTALKMNDGTLKKIVDIQVSDVLSNNNVVTAKVKVTKECSTMYTLNNIIVSDSHIVKYKDKWIPVSKHPYAVIYDDYNEEYLYCLNTTHKIIEINDVIFTDWDEIYDETLNKVLNNKTNPVPNTNSIHEYLDCGFYGSTKIRANNGMCVDINNIKVNDILQNGEKVYGIVEIDGSTLIQQFRYNLGENKIVEGYAPNLIYINKENINNEHKLYHLLTDVGTFMIENAIIKDYNATIDRFLE
jgi:hypothetical protein